MVTATHLVTGAFGYTGSRIAERLLARGDRMLTVTRDLCVALHPANLEADVDAAGAEVLRLNELVHLVRGAVGSWALVVHMPAWVVQATTRVLGLAVRDVVLTRDEIRELTDSLLVARDGAALCQTRISDWLVEFKRPRTAVVIELSRNFRIRRAPPAVSR